LISWAKRNSINAALLESYTSAQVSGVDGLWNDFVAIFLKDENHIDKFPKRILETKSDISNGILYGNNNFIKPSELPEDRKKLIAISKIIDNQLNLFY